MGRNPKITVLLRKTYMKDRDLKNSQSLDEKEIINEAENYKLLLILSKVTKNIAYFKHY